MEDEGRTGRAQEVLVTHGEHYLAGTGALLVAVLWITRCSGRLSSRVACVFCVFDRSQSMNKSECLC